MSRPRRQAGPEPDRARRRDRSPGEAPIRSQGYGLLRRDLQHEQPKVAATGEALLKKMKSVKSGVDVKCIKSEQPQIQA